MHRFNQLNRVFDLGFKALPWGNTGYVAAGLREIGEEGEPVPVRAVCDKPVSSETDLAPAPWQRAANWLERLTLPPAAPQRQALRARLKRFFFEQRCRVLARLAETWSLEGFDHDSEIQKLIQVLTPVLRQALREIVNDLAGSPVSLPAETLSKCCRWHEHELRALCERLFHELKATVREAAANSESALQIAARVRATYNTAGEAEAEKFAQSAIRNLTETAKGLCSAVAAV